MSSPKPKPEPFMSGGRCLAECVERRDWNDGELPRSVAVWGPISLVAHESSAFTAWMREANAWAAECPAVVLLPDDLPDD